MIMLEAPTEFWSHIKNNLKSKNSDNKLLQTYFEPTDLLAVEDSKEGKKFRLGVPTVLHKYWISENLFDRICTEISALYKSPFQVELVVTGQNSQGTNSDSPDSFMSRSQPHQAPLVASSLSTFSPNLSTPKLPATEDRTIRRDFLNPDYTFSTFVV